MSPASPLRVDDAIPALLQHLSSALTSTEPSPEVYPLLTPLLQQRVRLLGAPPSHDPWASLLTWTMAAGSQLVHHLSTINLSAHPVSGEIEPGKVILAGYRRVDAETLESVVRIPDLGLEVIYHWISEGHDGSWLVNDVHQLGGTFDTSDCHSSLVAAEGAFLARRTSHIPFRQAHEVETSDESDEDDSYWAMYDTDNTQTPVANDGPALTEDEYFSRFHNEVTETSGPALDGASTESTNGISPGRVLSEVEKSFSSHSITSPEVTQYSPRPIYPPASNSPRIEGLQQQAGREGNEAVAVQQHIGYTMKSLYRLARATGMDPADFEDVVRRELALLPMMEED